MSKIKHVALQIDPIEGLNPETDTSLLLGLGAQLRGAKLACYTPDTLSWDGRQVIARCASLILKEDGERILWIKGGGENRPLADFDVVLQRQDPPFDMAYLTTTWLLERLPKSTLVINPAVALRNAPEKLSVLDFSTLIAPTIVTRQPDVIRAFAKEHADIAIKPLHSHGGQGVIRLRDDLANLDSLLEMYDRLHPGQPLMVQRWLTGEEKRLILIDGKLEGALVKTPAEGGTRGNIRAGGSISRAMLNASDHHIAAEVGQWLRERKIMLAGLDIIGDKLLEINVTSPTLLRQINRLENIRLEAYFWEVVERHRKKG